MQWLPIAFIAPLLFALYQALSKILPKGTSSYLVNAYASLVGLVLMLALYFLTQRGEVSLKLSPKALYLTIAMGVLISLGNYAIIKAYSLGAPQAQYTAIMYSTLIVYGLLIGLLAFHEKLHLPQLLGVFLAGIGLFLIAYFRK
ncbi:EamA family transporter [Candidatus Saccharibacteria bacterium]|nr:EamA family transporter [Candidatus Saccharibacteria bacterium]